jgi:two-component system sensor histidine kinase KdpD
LLNSILILAFITFISHLFRDSLDIINIALIHLIPVVIVSMHGNMKSTIFITLVSVIFFNFLYVPPIYSFTVHNELYIWSFIIFGIVGWIITYQSKKLNTQKRQNELRESILHIVSHDLRTPLSTIHGSINLILSNKNLDGKKIESLLEDINYASIRMNRLITNLFDSARLSTNEIDLKLEWCDFEDIIGVALSEFPLKQTNDNLEIHINNVQLFWGDNTLLTQLVVNLLDNAFKYALSDTKIILSLKQVDHNILLSIFNKSHKIDNTKLENIFDKFYRIEDTDDISGSGIGLAICKSVVILHNGVISARAINDGIEINVSLPIVKKVGVV